MLDRLPVEVLLQCLSYMSKKDQLECLRVQKSTLTAIQTSGVVYESITITRLDDFADMHAFFTKHKKLAKLVKKLHLLNIALNVYTYMTLPALFPKVKEFVYINTHHPQRDYDDKEVAKAFKPWAATLESLKEFGSPIAAFSLLANVACPQLKNLSLNLQGMDDEELKFALYDYLKHCPNVKLLDLKYINITVEFMEKIHTHLPNLEVLSLTQVGIPPGNFKGTPQPAKKMETLFLYEFTTVADVNPWFTYMSKKYPNLKNLCIGKAEDMDDENIIYTDTNGLVKLIKQAPKLEFYSVSCFKLTPAIIKAIDSTGIQLKKIELSFFAEEGFKLLMKSQQIHSLTSLTISDTSYEGMTFEKREKKFLKDLSEIKHLKHLRINQSKIEVDNPDTNRVPLDDLLAAVPLLESMQMDFFTLVIQRTSEEPFDTKVKKLVLEECYVEAVALKGQEDWGKKSRERLQKLLPNTDIEYRELDDTPPLDEYNHLLQFR